MATGAAEMMRRCVFDGSIPLHDSVIERRPYHRNCTCALHKLKYVSSDKVCFHRRTVAFPTKKTSLADCSLCIAAPRFCSRSVIFQVKTEITFRNLCQVDDSRRGICEA